MFKPLFEISPKLLENIKRIAVLIENLNNKKYPEVVLAEFEKSAREISAYSSTSIEGNPLPLTEVKKILKSQPAHIRDTEKEVLNYNNALIELEKISSDKSTTLNIELLNSIQKNVTSGLIKESGSGKIRTEPVVVNDPREKKVVYIPPDAKDAPDLLKKLSDFTLSNENLDSLIVAGIFHKQFVLIHPYIDGNGRTVRLATKLLLAKLGINTFRLFSFENYYNKNVTRYFQFVGERGDYYELKDKINFTPWLEYFTDGIIDELLRVEKELTGKEIKTSGQIKEHHQIILDYIKQHGFISDKIYSGLCKRSKASRNGDFNRLIKLGLIEREGKGKATIYKLK